MRKQRYVSSCAGAKHGMNTHSLDGTSLNLIDANQKTQASGSQNCVAIQQHQVVKAQLLRHVTSVTEDNLINALRTHTCITSTEPRKWPQDCPWQTVMAVVWGESQLGKLSATATDPQHTGQEVVDVNDKQKAVRTLTDDVDAHLSICNF